jgi:hypothetical protein
LLRRHCTAADNGEFHGSNRLGRGLGTRTRHQANGGKDEQYQGGCAHTEEMGKFS